MSIVPVPAGLTAVREVALLYVTDAAAFVPNSTVDPEVNPVPLTVTDVPPPRCPWFGVTEATAGIGS
jgi:hypothetical protein